MARTGDAVRTVIERLVSAEVSVEDLDSFACDIERLASKLESFPQGRTYEGFSEAANSGSPIGFFDYSPVSGTANPLAPPLRFEIPEDAQGRKRVLAWANYGFAYEGPPGCVHGGYLAAAFDEVLGRAQSLSGSPGMTASLSISYRNATPLGVELEFEGFLVKVEGRKVFARGECRHLGKVTAEAEALFISIDFEKLAAIAASQHRA